MARPVSEEPTQQRQLPGDSALPLYARVQQAIEQEMRYGLWAPPAALPSEQELSQRYGVSRATVRQALQRLADRGLVYRHAGIGSFALRRKPAVQFDRYISFGDDLRARGHVPGSRLLSVAVVPATGLAAELLELEPETPVLRLERVRFADDLPVAYGCSHMRYDLVRGLEHDDLTDYAFSLHAHLKERYGVEFVRSRATLRPALATAHIGSLIEQPPGAPIFELRTQNYLDNGRVAEFAHDFFHPDRLVIELHSSE